MSIYGLTPPILPPSLLPPLISANLIVALLLATVYGGLQRFAEDRGSPQAVLYRSVALGWLFNTLYLGLQMWIAWREVHPPPVKELYSFPSTLALSFASSAFFWIGSVASLRNQRRGSDQLLKSRLAALGVAIFFFIGLFLLQNNVSRWLGSLFDIAALFALSMALYKLINGTDAPNTLAIRSSAALLAVGSLLGYLAIQTLALPLGVFGDTASIPKDQVAIYGFSLGAAFKLLHLIGIASIFSSRLISILQLSERSEYIQKKKRHIYQLAHDLTTNGKALELHLEQLDFSTVKDKNDRDAIRKAGNIGRLVVAMVRGACFNLLEEEEKHNGSENAAGKRKRSTQRFNVNDLLQASLQSVRGIVDESLDAKTSIDSQLSRLPAAGKMPLELRRVFTNLFKNSYEALGEKGGKIEIFTTRDKETNELVITVIDNGHGITKEDLPLVKNERFSTKDGPGRGFGLYISDTIVRQLGGTLDIASQINEWTKITIRLPIEEAAP